jgi:hypothetical protein
VTLEEAQAALANIDAEIAKAESMVVFGDRTVMKKTNSDLLRAREVLVGQVAQLQSATSGRRRQHLGYSGKGF